MSSLSVAWLNDILRRNNAALNPLYCLDVACGDGASFRVAANVWSRCTPRDNEGPWTHVEVYWDDGNYDSSLAPYRTPHPVVYEGRKVRDDSVHHRVPVEVVADIIDRRGLLIQGAVSAVHARPHVGLIDVANVGTNPNYSADQ